ncbi:ATP-dependent RNA helicase SUPV3L1, mitochondrial-like [Paramacrobiotus metropolitanus]|uniref:ATP-dependent RNA helicase SUPV3L1, mitochondrial-like n=1 Tax=Paramacrobiotus metropolitanus TaxID=2943436 RepID=UPI0024459EAB|nr:ATP-dependent RNA helicase SUPV3L1, mitochondrial-like [Paramacrobiotus metropolitanus]
MRIFFRPLLRVISHSCTRCGGSLLPCSSTSVLRQSAAHLDHYPPFLGGVRHKSTQELSALFVPVPVEPAARVDGAADVGEEITGKLDREELLKALNLFYRRSEIKKLAEEHGLDTRLFHQAFISFRKYCAKSSSLPPELHILFSDLISGAGHIDDLFPYFLKHAKQCFPHLECMEDLRKISDLRSPANWYPEARLLRRKVIFHAGPTNSGKTYEAMEHFLRAKSGIYCGPLKLLASEVFHKTNGRGVKCDLITGEERRYADPEGNPSAHVACTVEMASSTNRYEVGIVDEIQMIRDNVRGWAWSRSVLGLCVDELHICGEGSAIELIREMLLDTGEDLEVKTYKRLTPLTVLDKPLQSMDNIQNGDCVVAFSKNDIYSISRQIEQRGMSCAVIYGGLPPGTKLAQAKNFNDPEHETNVLVATDAIGMGLNLNIKRVIFYSLLKPNVNEKGEKDIELLTTSQALQIAGRAGRFGTQYENGEVTTFRGEDLPTLKDILARSVDSIEAAGLHPTADQIELFAYHLPNATLSNLIDIFVSICQVDHSLYFMCNIEDFKFLADTIQHVPLPLKTRYAFCCAPISRKQPFVCSVFLKFARQFSRGDALTFEWVTAQLGWPFEVPQTIAELQHLENVFDVFDLYLWLSYRFTDMFPDAVPMRAAQKDLDKIIHEGVSQITKLILQQQSSENLEDIAKSSGGRDSYVVKKLRSAVNQMPRAGKAERSEPPVVVSTLRRPRGSSTKR